MTFGLGEFYALACAVCWAIGIVLFKHSGESLSANSLNLFKNVFSLVLLVPTTWFFAGFYLPDFSAYEWFIIIATGYVGIALADSMYLQGLRMLGAGRLAIVASLYSPFVIVLSIFILHEKLLAWQWFGFAFVLSGILLVVYQKKYSEIDKNHLYKGVAFAASSVFLTALGVVLVKPILTDDNFFQVVTLRLLAGVIGMMIYLLVRQKWRQTIHEYKQQNHQWLNIIIASFFATYLSMTLWLAGFQYTTASTASVLNELANVFIVLFAWWFLKEKLSKRKVLGISLAFTGVLIFLGVFKAL